MQQVSNDLALTWSTFHYMQVGTLGTLEGDAIDTSPAGPAGVKRY